MKSVLFGLVLCVATLFGVSANACNTASVVNYGVGSCNSAVSANYGNVAVDNCNANLVEVRRVEFAEVPGLALRSFANVDNYNNQVLVRNIVVDRNYNANLGVNDYNNNVRLLRVNENQNRSLFNLNLFGNERNRNNSLLNLNIGQNRNRNNVEVVKVVKVENKKANNKVKIVKIKK